MFNNWYRVDQLNNQAGLAYQEHDISRAQLGMMRIESDDGYPTKNGIPWM